MSVGAALLFLAGIALLVGGAELLVRGASRLATTAGIPSLVVGLTVVAFGTSAPELAVSVGSAHGGRGDVAVGNAVGSNIFNVLFILGVSALVAPLTVERQLVRLDLPVMIGASLLTWFLALDGRIARVDGLVLVAILVLYTAYMAWRTRGSDVGGPEDPGEDPAGGAFWKNVLLILGGLGLLVFGARWLVDAATEAATALGVDELVIGLTVVAAGTSLPEVATSILATLRGEREIAVGNVVGSNIFNLLGVLGVGSLVASRGVGVPPGAITFDIPVMTAVAVATLPIFLTRWAITRWEGAVFLGYYVGYTTYLGLAATEHAALPAFRTAMTWFALPLTGLTLGISGVRVLIGSDGTAAGSR